MEAAGSRKPAAYALYRMLWQSLDWLFPPACAGCSAPGTRWCDACAASVRECGDIVCEKCGDPQAHPGVCGRCRINPPPYRALRSYAVFSGPLRNAMHRLKYKKDVAVGDVLALPLIDLLARLDWQPEMIVPVPLSKSRMRERGYNQVSLLAQPVALALGIAYRPAALYRLRDTQSQVGMSAAARRANLQGAFAAQADRVRGRRVLVMDDVTTTGATIEAACAALAEAGCDQAYGLTLARAVKGDTTSDPGAI